MLNVERLTLGKYTTLARPLQSIGKLMFFGVVVSVVATFVSAQGVDISSCTSITDAKERLACFGLLARQQERVDGESVEQTTLEELKTLIEKLEFSAAGQLLKESVQDMAPNEVDTLEQMALSSVRPIPSSDISMNLGGYRLLSLLRPTEKRYIAKIDSYAARLESGGNESFFSSLRMETELATGNRLYYDPTDPTFVGSRSRISAVIVEPQNSRPRLLLRIVYVADSWLLVEGVDAILDGNSTRLTYGEFSRDNTSTIWEWRSESPSTAQRQLLKKIEKADQIVLRFYGNEFYNDRRLQQMDKGALKRVLSLFLAFEEDRLKNKIEEVEGQDKFVPQMFTGGVITGKP